MIYSDFMLQHFFEPKNVGQFSDQELNVGRSQVGSVHNGAVVIFEIKVIADSIAAAKFKAYGNGPVIAAASFATEWVTAKKIQAAGLLTAQLLIQELAIPQLKISAALLVEDAVKQAIADYVHQSALQFTLSSL